MIARVTCAIALIAATALNAAGETGNQAATEAAEQAPPPMPATRAQELLAALAEDDIEAAMAAADELAAVGPAALPHLLAASGTADETARERITRILGRIQHPDALAALNRMLEDESEAVRREAIGALGSHGRAESVEKLKPFLLVKNPRLRLQAATALGRIGRNSEAARPAVLGLLRISTADDDARVRKAAVVGIGLMNDPAAIPVLIMRLRDEDLTVRVLAHLLLKKISNADLEYDPTDDLAWREEAIVKWETWWKKHNSDTGGSTGKQQDVQH